MKHSDLLFRAMAFASLFVVLTFATSVPASGTSERSAGTPQSGELSALAREIVTARRQLNRLSDQIDEAETALRRVRNNARRELESSPDIERARLDLRDARHDYYTARDKVLSKLKDQEEYARTLSRIRELDQEIAALQPQVEEEVAQSAAAEEQAATAAPAAAETEQQDPAPIAGEAAQDRLFELAQQKLRLADKAGSIEVEALRADAEVQEAWDHFNTAATRLNRLEGQIDEKLREHEALAEAQDRLERLEREHETLMDEYVGARAAYRTALAEREREEEFRRRNAWPRDDWYLWRRFNRRNR